MGEMSDHIPTPVDKSSSNFQVYDAFRRLDQGDRLTFGGGIDDHEVVFCHHDTNIVFLWTRRPDDSPYPSEPHELGECLSLRPAYAVRDDGPEMYAPSLEIIKYSGDENPTPNTIGTLTDATVRNPDDRDYRVCDVGWDADFSGPQPDRPDQEPFDDPDAVIRDASLEEHYFEYEQEPAGGPPARTQFYIEATNYGAAHIVPFGCQDPVARIDISTTIGELKTFLEEHMDPDLRKAYEQTGETPKHLLAAEQFAPARFND